MPTMPTTPQLPTHLPTYPPAVGYGLEDTTNMIPNHTSSIPVGDDLKDSATATEIELKDKRWEGATKPRNDTDVEHMLDTPAPYEHLYIPRPG